jgi:4-carboxymuconolactone decarboxylase
MNELAILIQARLLTSQVEWYAHYPLAIKSGLPEAVAADLKQGKRPTTMKPDESVVYDFCMELSTTHAVSDATFKKAKEMLGEQQLVDLVVLSGTYITVAMLLSAAEEGVPAGKTPPLSPLPAR